MEWNQCKWRRNARKMADNIALNNNIEWTSKKIAELSQSNQVSESTGFCYSITTCWLLHTPHDGAVLGKRYIERENKRGTASSIVPCAESQHTHAYTQEQQEQHHHQRQQQQWTENIRLPFCYAVIALSTAVHRHTMQKNKVQMEQKNRE